MLVSNPLPSRNHSVNARGHRWAGASARSLVFFFASLSLSFLQEGIAHIAVSLQGLGQVVRRIVGPGPQFHGDRAVNPLIEILTRDSRQHPFFPPDVVFMLSLSSSVVKLDTPHSRKSRRVYS